MSDNKDTGAGLGFALGAYILWGFLPLYLKLLDHIPAVEVVAHRIIWSVPVAGLLLILLRRTADLREALRSPRMLAMGCVTAVLITLNWGIYVWSIAVGQTLEAALADNADPVEGLRRWAIT